VLAVCFVKACAEDVYEPHDEREDDRSHRGEDQCRQVSAQLVIRAAHAERRKNVELREIEQREEAREELWRVQNGRVVAQDLESAQDDFGLMPKASPDELPQSAE